MLKCVKNLIWLRGRSDTSQRLILDLPLAFLNGILLNFFLVCFYSIKVYVIHTLVCKDLNDFTASAKRFLSEMQIGSNSKILHYLQYSTVFFLKPEESDLLIIFQSTKVLRTEILLKGKSLERWDDSHIYCSLIKELKVSLNRMREVGPKMRIFISNWITSKLSSIWFR